MGIPLGISMTRKMFGTSQNVLHAASLLKKLQTLLVTLFLFSPKERLPIIGFSGLVLMSTTGAKFMCTPSLLECWAILAPTSSINFHPELPPVSYSRDKHRWNPAAWQGPTLHPYLSIMALLKAACNSLLIFRLPLRTAFGKDHSANVMLLHYIP